LTNLEWVRTIPEMNTDADAAEGAAASRAELMPVPARIWYVVRLAQEDDEDAHPHLAFPSQAEAEAHAARATREDGAAHQVLDMPFAVRAPEPVIWHRLSTDISLSGARLWTTSTVLRTFPGVDDCPSAPSALWRIILRDAPSKPQSRVRLEIVGHSQAWCVAAVKTCWVGASTSPEFTQARQLEDMFARARQEDRK